MGRISLSREKCCGDANSRLKPLPQRRRTQPPANVRHQFMVSYASKAR